MSTRSSTANAGQAGRHGRPRSYAWVLVLLVMAWTGVPGAARADAIILQNGDAIDGSIVDATRNTVIVRRAMDGMRQMPIRDIAEIRLDLGGGEQIAGQLLGWVDGVHEVRFGGDIVRVSAGRILTRERRDQRTTPPPRPPRPLAPRPREEPMVKVAGPAASAPEAPRAELDRSQAATTEVAPASKRAAVVGATSIASANKPPAVAAPTPVRIAVTPRALAPVEDPVAAAAIAGVVPAKVSKAAVAPAAVIKP
jgi:RNase P/RNase MRP subunit p29